MELVLKKITEYRDARGWSEYQLAEKSGIPQSTISSWYCKGSIPTVPTLKKICDVFDITLSELFAVGDSPVVLTKSQKELLEKWSRLDKAQQEAVLQLIERI